MTPSLDALRRPRMFGGVAGRAARVLTTAVCALALSVGAVAVALVWSGFVGRVF